MKRLGLALGAVLLTHSSDAFAESRWEKLEEGFNVVRECAGDVVQHCKGVLPGEGRIKACMKEHLAELSTTCLKALAGPEPKALSDGANARPKRIENTHLLRYIEIFLAGLKPDTGNIVASCYGTYANPDIPASKDTAPQALVEGLDMDKIKEEYGVLGASLNGPKLWLPDWLEVDVGVEREFNGIKAPWTAELNLGKKVSIGEITAYKPETIARKSGVGWNKGTPVTLIDDTEGNTWVMKGFQLCLKPQYTYKDFMAAGASNFKKLPSGWKVRVVTLEKDLIEAPEGGIATIMPDEFFNVYDKTGPGMTNYKP